MSVKMEKNYRDDLVANIRAVGQELIDRADQMVSPDLDMISDFEIHIHFDPSMHGFPTLTFQTAVVPKRVIELYNKK